MKLDFPIFCDYAGQDGAGRSNLIGIFRSIQVESLPYAHPRFYFVAFLSVPEQVESPLIVTVEILDPDGNPTDVKATFQADIPKSPPGKHRLEIQLSLEINNFTITKLGDYRVMVKSQLEDLGIVMLRVSQKEGENS